MTNITLPMKCFFVIIAMCALHFLIFAFGVKTNTVRGVGLDEGRYIPAGVYHWRHGGFALASDTPPLARMVAALPLLPLRVGLEADVRRVPGDDARDRELRYGGRFASSGQNLHWYRFYCLSRMMGFLWWLLGASVLFRWSAELNGVAAGFLALALWCVGAPVLALEQQVLPELPLAVIWATATYAFRGYLRAPSWEKAAASGLLLGAAQLVDFASLALFATWPLVVLLRGLTRAAGTPAGVTPRTAMLQAALAIGLSIWIINLGYMFRASGATLGSFEFASRVLRGGSPSPGERVVNRADGNRFRGTWLGEVMCPVPADYLKGLDRRLDGREGHAPSRRDEGWPVEVGDDPLAKAGDRRPIGLWAMVLGGLLLMPRRRPGYGFGPEEWTLYLPVGAALLLTTSAIGLLTIRAGILLTTPFAIVFASAVGRSWRSEPRVIASVAAVLSLWAVGDGLYAIYADQLTPENRARFRRDLDKYCGRLGLPPVVGGGSSGLAGERGLLHRTFIDSRGVAMNYALFIPRDYSGDRPYPLLLFLHGHGDRGTAGRRFTEVGLPFVLEHREIDFLVLCPQARSGSWKPGGDDVRRTMELLAAIEKDYRVDVERISLTGMSSGGRGVWDLAAAYPDRWAAIAPVASGHVDSGQAPRIKHLPCWCFHNRYDGGSPVAKVRGMIRALRDAGATPRYTEYLDINHDAWDRAYNSTELFEWLLQQRIPRLRGPGHAPRASAAVPR